MHQKEHLFCYSQTLWVPKHSMYAIYAYIGVVLGVNVGIYGIHGVFGVGMVDVPELGCLQDIPRVPDLSPEAAWLFWGDSAQLAGVD